MKDKEQNYIEFMQELKNYDKISRRFFKDMVEFENKFTKRDLMIFIFYLLSPKLVSGIRKIGDMKDLLKELSKKGNEILKYYYTKNPMR